MFYFLEASKKTSCMYFAPVLCVLYALSTSYPLNFVAATIFGVKNKNSENHHFAVVSALLPSLSYLYCEYHRQQLDTPLDRSYEGCCSVYIRTAREGVGLPPSVYAF
jgi:hypothetical protein